MKDTQQCREAIRPWKGYAADTGAAVLLVTHVNRMASPNARDTYGLSGGLRQVARSSIYVMRDGDELIAGPEKSNVGRTDIPAERFIITPVQMFDAAPGSDGTVGRLDYVGPSDRTVKQHLAAKAEAAKPKTESRTAAVDGWLTSRLADGPVPSADIANEGATLNYSADQIDRSRKRIGANSAKCGDVWFTEMRSCGDAESRSCRQDRNTAIPHHRSDMDGADSGADLIGAA
ncbi:MAG: hypothetical protein QOE04_4802 [Mycobacterium sp.]|nr:hypothetical protein [Mycobacterium sp.]